LDLVAFSGRMSQSGFEEELKALLKVDSRLPTRLVSRESQRLEYKQAFDWSRKHEYAKSMAAFANNRGGFLVFGVRPKPHEMIGVNAAFDKLDDAEVSTYLASALAPEFEWSRFSIELSGVRLGVIAVAPCKRGPVICQRNDGDLRDGSIYYRYRAQTRQAQYPEVRRIIDDAIAQEREDLLKLLGRLVTVGPGGVALFDFQNAELMGRAGTMVIGEDVLRKVKFVREGKLDEREGAPTLRVLADVVPVPSGAIAGVRPVEKPVAVTEQEILSAFLKQGSVGAPEVYLQQVCNELTGYMPIYFFARQAKLGLAALRTYIEENCIRPQTRRKLLARCNGETVAPMGSLSASSTEAEERRVALAAAEKGDEKILRRVKYRRLFEAVSHLGKVPTKPALLKVLLDLVECEYGNLGSSDRSMLRKAVSKLDELQNLKPVAMGEVTSKVGKKSPKNRLRAPFATS